MLATFRDKKFFANINKDNFIDWLKAGGYPTTERTDNIKNEELEKTVKEILTSIDWYDYRS